jgi:hypothetical protein
MQMEHELQDDAPSSDFHSEVEAAQPPQLSEGGEESSRDW